MAPKRVDKVARRQEILDAAVRVFARKGFAASRIDDIAAEAGIGKGSVYLYFDSRDAILEAAFAQYAADSEALLRQAVEGEGPALDRLAALVRAAISLVAASRDLARILLDLWASVDMTGVYRDYRGAIAQLLREASDTVRPGTGPLHAIVIVGAIEGAVLQWLIDPEVPIAELAQPILDVCVEGIRA